MDGGRLQRPSRFRFRCKHEERSGVVTRHAEVGLREVVRAEAEELRRLRDLVRGERTARDFDHRADGVGDLHFLFFLHERGDFVNDDGPQPEESASPEKTISFCVRLFSFQTSVIRPNVNTSFHVCKPRLEPVSLFPCERIYQADFLLDCNRAEAIHQLRQYFVGRTSRSDCPRLARRQAVFHGLNKTLN